MNTHDDVPAVVRELAARLSAPRPMRRGSLSERSMKCGKANCRCQQDAQARHGPYFSLTRVEGGKTRSRYVDAAKAAVARRQVDAAQEFRKLLEVYWQRCEDWADAELGIGEAASQEAAKKGGSKQSSRARSSRRLKRS